MYPKLTILFWKIIKIHLITNFCDPHPARDFQKQEHNYSALHCSAYV